MSDKYDKQLNEYISKTDLDNFETDNIGTQTKKVSLYAWDKNDLTKKRLTGTEVDGSFAVDSNIGDRANLNLETLAGVVETNDYTGKTEARVFSENHICEDNTSNTPLGIDEVFTGEWYEHQNLTNS